MLTQAEADGLITVKIELSMDDDQVGFFTNTLFTGLTNSIHLFESCFFLKFKIQFSFYELYII